MAISLWPASHAGAHGEAPRVLSVLTTSGNTATAVRVTEGLARLDESGWRYVCPALWGDDEASPAVGDGSKLVFVGGAAGVFVLEGDGSVASHPAGDAARGRTLALAASGGHSWQLRANGADASQLLELTAAEARVVATDVPPWDSLAADEDVVQLVRLSGTEVQELRLSADGSELGRDSAPAPDGAIAAFARMAGGTPYVVLLTNGGLGSELGTLEGGTFRSLVSASGSIAGPVVLPSGQTLVATGGMLAELRDEGAVPVRGEEAIVTCLGKTNSLSYACAGPGAYALDESGLGAELFTLDDLGAPDTGGLDAEVAANCDLQWERFSVDLASIGVTPGTGQDAATPADAETPAADAGPTRTGHRAGSGGCSAAGGPEATGWLAFAFVLLASRREKSALSKKMTGDVTNWRD